MRKLLYLSLSALCLAGSVRAGSGKDSGPTLYEARGFLAGRCFRHPAVRECVAKPDGLRCTLRVFPSTNAQLSLPLDPATDGLIPGRTTRDFGIFEFRISAYDALRSPVVRILGVRRVPLGDWEATRDREVVANPVSCPPATAGYRTKPPG